MANDKIHVSCPNCSKEMKFSLKFAGKTGMCPACSAKFRIEEKKQTEMPVKPVPEKFNEAKPGSPFGAGETTPMPIKKAKQIINEAQKERQKKEGWSEDDDWDISTYFGKSDKK